MTIESRLSHTGTGGIFRRFAKDKKGVGAIEFAIIFPLLVSLYLTSFELTLGFSVYKRATRSAGTIADNVSAQSSVTKAYLKTMKNLAATILSPYSADGMKLKITGIAIDANQVATVAWSWDQDDGRPYTLGARVDVPANLRSAADFLVHAEFSVPHELLTVMPTLSSNLKTITISRDYYFAKREGDPIVCGDC